MCYVTHTVTQNNAEVVCVHVHCVDVMCVEKFVSIVDTFLYLRAGMCSLCADILVHAGVCVLV